MTNITSTPRHHWLVNGAFARLWLGQVVSVIGDFLFATTAVLWIAQTLARGQSWAPLAVASETVAVMLPALLVGPLAGVFVDRWPKRRTLMAMDALRAITIASLVVLAALPAGTVPLPIALGGVYMAIVLAATCAQLFNPARLAFIGDLVPPDARAHASSLIFMTVSLGVILGPAIAAPLFFAVGPAWALAMDSASFVVSLALISTIRMPVRASAALPTTPPNLRREFMEGLRTYRHNAVLRTLLSATALTLFGSGAINALGLFFLQTNLHSGAGAYGILSVATGVGVLGGSFVAAWAVPKLGAARSFGLSTLVVGALLLVYARQTALAPALAILAFIGLPSAGINVAIGPLILAATPRELVGRVYAIFVPATNAMALLAAAGSGALVSTGWRQLHGTFAGLAFGPYDTIYVIASLIILGSGAYAWQQLSGATLPAPTQEPMSTAPAVMSQD